MVGDRRKVSHAEKLCVVIGTTYLCVSILELLQKYHWNVLSVVSKDSAVESYCKRNKIRVLNSLEQVREKGFILFSVVNYFIISECFLKLHEVKYAMNYHDSTLPKYGGVNSTTWAIFNNEIAHGVSWHLISGKIDEGDLVKQKSFAITPKETAFSLNLKCSSEALKLFDDFLRDFDSGFILTSRQDLRNKSYFGKNRIPENYGIIDFRDNFEKLDRMYRALDFGGKSYCNPVGTIKIWDGSEFFLFDSFSFIRDEKSIPGKVYSFSKSSLLIGIHGGKLVINNIRTPEGEKICVSETKFNNGLIITPYCINDKEKKDLEIIKKSESKILTDFFSENVHRSVIFDTELIVQYKAKYHRDLSYNSLDLNNALSRVLLSLFAFLGKDVCIPIKFELDSYSRLLNRFMFNMNLVKLGNSQKSLNYRDFVNIVTGYLKEIQIVPRDLINRYHIDNTWNHIEVFCSRKRLSLGKQRIRVTLTKNHVYIDGYEKDKEIIDSIYSFIKNIISNTQLDNSVNIKDCLSDSIQNEGTSNFFCEKNTLIAKGNSTKGYSPQFDSLSFLEAFEKQALYKPKAVAILFKGKQLNYGCLNEKANQFARYLKKRGARPGSLIGVGFDRSLELVIALLGIIKSGCAYLPIDPSHPAQRIKFILKDAQVDYLVTKSSLSHLFHDNQENFIFIDKEKNKISREKKSNFTRKTDEGRLAFVIYTSGSTGKPKGVEIFESSLNNLIYSVQKRMKFTSDDRWLALTTISFDIAVLELFLPLTKGASLVLVSDADLNNPKKITKLIDLQKVTVVQSTPSRYQMLMDMGWKCGCKTTIISTGEALPENLAKQLLRFGVNLWNGYGPSETTVWSSIDRVTSSDQTITIGYPLDNTYFYVLDKNQRIQPVGVPGELYIGGAGLARGYRNRKELTKSRFVPSPFGRLYRTGDLVRRLQDGRIEYIGRLDHQVKLRGFRIELGEIEEILNKVKGVNQVVVTTYEAKPGDLRLVAYFQGETLQNNLEKAAGSFLPSYMHPSMYIKIENFPLTPNQKIDRSALPPPKTADNGYIAPKGVCEEKVASIFAHYLGVDKVGRDGNFFSLGGHSLLVVQVISEINKAFCINLPLNILFEHPSVKALTLQVESALKVGERNSQPIKKYPQKESYELSSSQQRIWFAEQLASSKTLYSIPQLLEISGPLDIKKFRQAIQIVFKKHGIFKAVFEERNGEIRQAFRSLSKAPFRYVDYSKEKSPSVKAKATVSSEAKKGFDLKKGPLSRFLLIRLSHKKHLLFFNVHHIIFDGLSTNIFLKDVCRLYESNDIAEEKYFRRNHPQYSDYVSWEREQYGQSTSQPAIDFFKEKLKESSLLPFLPSDKERPKALSHKGSSLSFSIKKNCAEKIYSLVRENETTLFTFMLAAFHILLARYSSQREFVIGVPYSRRDNSSLDSMIGFFINILPFPTSSKASEAFVDLLNRFSKESAEISKNGDVSIDQLSQELGADKSAAHSPIFQVMLNLLPRTAIQKVGNLDIKLKQIDRGTSHFDLSLTLQEWSSEIVGYLEYSTEVFSKKLASGISKHFQSLVKEIIKDPYQPISEYQFLSPGEMQEIIISWNNSMVKYDRKKTIVECFEDQATRMPSQIAVICGNKQLSYEELNHEANKLAHALLDKGIKPEDKIVVCLDRTEEFIIAILGILKSGAAYVPIDPAEPEDRAQSIFSEIAPAYVVTHSSVRTEFKYPHMLYVDKIGCIDISNPSIKNLSNHLAYIIYTSGSTGKPKGVEIEHGSINDRVMWKQATYPLSNQDVMLHTYSFVFDGAIINYFWSLCAGSTLLITTNLEQYDPGVLVELIQEYGVSVADMLPSLILGIVEVDDFKKCSSLKYVFSGGEALSGEIIRMFYKNCSSATLYNTYGPTEATVEASVWKCDPKFSGTIAPIGRPIAGSKLYVLDKHQKVVPIGVQGELYIGGLGLARSYLNDSKLTYEKFIRSPFDSGRLYRTGDLVKRDFKGDLEFLGRVDHQVKIRGYRIELGEIESSLLHMDQVERAAVVVKGGGISKKIIAYLQLSPRMSESSFQALMEQFLGKRLPRYMIPARVVVLKNLPTLLNGKVNYKALPEPDNSLKVPIKPKENPNCGKEIKLLSLWRELLNFADLSISDNFFEVGGNSLLAMRLITRINKEMETSLPLVALFHHPTIKSLASFIKKPIKKHNKSAAVLMKGQGNKAPFFCVHPVGGSILCYNNLARHWASEHPLYALQAKGFEGKERPLKSIKSMACEYIKAIKKIQKEGPYFVGGWSFGGLVASEITRQLLEKGDEVRALVIIDTSVKIDKFRKIDVSSEYSLYSELLDYYNIDPNKDYKALSPKEKLFQLLEWGGQKACSIEKIRIKRTLSVAKANYRALQKYFVSPLSKVPIFVLKAENSLEGVSDDLGWGNYTETTHVYNMPGNHWGIVDDDLSKIYALVIEESINMVSSEKRLVGLQR